MNYLVYKITNKINGKIYIGVHRTENINDTYMGSGKLLKKAQKKYGIKNFEKEILYDFDNIRHMFDKEIELVDKDFIEDSNTYNLALGGRGGNHVPYDHPTHSIEHMKMMSNAGKENRNKALLEFFADDERKKTAAEKSMKIKREMYGNDFPKPFLGRTHTEETLQKMRDSKKDHGVKEKNSQFGTCWIYNLELKVNKKIKKEELETFIKLGWIKGRNLKF